MLIFYSIGSILLLQPRENWVEVFSMNASNNPLCALGPSSRAMTTPHLSLYHNSDKLVNTPGALVFEEANKH